MKRQKATEGTNCSCPKCKRRQRHIPPITDGNLEEEWRKFEEDLEASESEGYAKAKAKAKAKDKGEARRG